MDDTPGVTSTEVQSCTAIQSLLRLVRENCNMASVIHVGLSVSPPSPTVPCHHESDDSDSRAAARCATGNRNFG
eukprot:758952-Hanusia_phi.AAC.1